ncbi:MAG: hypothetical protein JNM59_06520 [Hyphomonadaceae bacterium]|nr:hypothetical protein [Hyphomonadaceae bacterium]
MAPETVEIVPGSAGLSGYVAELTSAFLGAELGLAVDHVECHAAYLDHWLSLLDRDPGALLAAAGHAQRAADYLRTFLDGATISPHV